MSDWPAQWSKQAEREPAYTHQVVTCLHSLTHSPTHLLIPGNYETAPTRIYWEHAIRSEATVSRRLIPIRHIHTHIDTCIHTNVHTSTNTHTCKQTSTHKQTTPTETHAHTHTTSAEYKIPKQHNHSTAQIAKKKRFNRGSKRKQARQGRTSTQGVPKDGTHM